MATAKNKDEYAQAWNSHIDELSLLGSALIISDTDAKNYMKLKELQKQLKELVKIAADIDYE